MINKHTKSMMSMLPQWMKMAKDPESVGAKFLNAFGVEISEVERYLEGIWNNMYIGTADLQKVDFCYKVPLALRDVVNVGADVHVRLVMNGERVECMPVDTVRLFFEGHENQFMIDETEGYVYIRALDYFMEENIFKPFDAIEIGDTLHYEYMLHHIWNPFDEFGMLLGIYRLPGERNLAFKERILDVFKNPGGATKNGLINGISRELGISKEDVKLGALSDDDYVQSTLINPDGTPNEKYIQYVDQINSNLGFSWDYMNWGEAYWRSIEEDNMGLHYLPHIWDGFSAQWKDEEIQSGIGGGDDLLVTGPKEESSVRNFKAYVGLHGTEEQVEEHNPELRFKYKIVAKGKVPNEEYDLEQYRYTLVASEIIPLHYTITAMKKFLFRTQINWDNRYGYTFKDNLNPGLEIVTGEDVLHNKEEAHVKIHVEMKTTDRTVTPSLQELIVEWTDTTDMPQTYRLTTDEELTSNTTAAATTFLDTEVVNGSVTLGKGSFSAVIDTEGSFKKGSPGVSVKINKTGSISLDLPK
ncbi:hypothetical protein [Cytobacillus oceanisediminis]|uniref:hypothetical protein n=1 Tax=Cytobacillus oceanisediminis TaxID=665099 RepID=UPI001FB333FA|nr:hypothetical protein [Cytobacillus oceanisediminis]UOE58071.1 hypothetical protein IRB79_27805 [Cytobacillus oceanisediminis]